MTSRGSTGKRRRSAAAAPRVGMFGVIGSDNLGNEGSLDAMLDWLKRDHPAPSWISCASGRRR
jgi:hypothetical protein